MAQVWFAPAAMAVTPLRSTTHCDTNDGIVSPSPSCPNEFSPQHLTWPKDLSAQACPEPTATAAPATNGVKTLVISPEIGSIATPCSWTSTGYVLAPGDPSPLVSPQHLTPPDTSTAHAVSPPAAIEATPLSRLKVATGVAVLTLVKLPSVPWMLEPQHMTAPPVVRAQVKPLPAAIAATPDDRPFT